MKIGIIGTSGRMGGELAKITLDNAVQGKCIFSGATVKSSDDCIGKDIGLLFSNKPFGVVCTDDYKVVIQNSDVVIDFTIPEHSIQIANAAAEYKTAHVCGTTGFSSAQLQEMENLAKDTRIFWAPNMSLPVNILAYLVEQAAQRLDNSFDIEILEMHHKDKVDVPSGTAIMLGKAAAHGRKINFEQAKVLARTSEHGARKEGEIGFAALRGGNIIGEHSVIFVSENEKVCLSHTMFNRKAFAESAFKIASWLPSQQIGKLYKVQDYIKATSNL